MPMKQRWISLALATLALVAMTPLAGAGPINRATIIVPLGAGGALDRMARRVATTMPDAANIQVDIENHPAKDGDNTGYKTFLRRPADGAHWLAWFEPGVAASRPDDFFENVAIINVQEIEPPVLAASKQTGWSSLADMTKGMSDAPMHFRIGIGGRAAGGPLLALALLDKLGLDASIVDFPSGGKARKALLRGEIDMVAGSVNAIRKISDSVVPLAVFSPRRIRAWPDVPTIREALGDRADAAVIGAVYRFIGVHRSFADANPQAFDALVQNFQSMTQDLRDGGHHAHWFGPTESTSLLHRAHEHFADLIGRVESR